MPSKPYVRVSQLQQAQPIVDSAGRPAAWFVRLINDNNGNVAAAINAIATLPAIQQALLDLDTATQAAQAAAVAAQTAADTAQGTTDANKREAALQGSYIEPGTVLSATPTTITITAHTRRYADGTSVTVNGGTIAATAMSDTDYISYNDPTRAGGAVIYAVSTTAPIQTGDTHVVGAVSIPTTGTVDGGDGPSPPGRVLPYKLQDLQ
ncbi:MAG TPA: hypothetical protein VF637_15305 [Sphingomicrobium sp.]|jgi:hypothetical protein